MLDLNWVIHDPNLAQQELFTVSRKTGGYDSHGDFTTSTTTIQMSGTITPAGTKALQQLPQGDINKGAIEILTDAEILVTHLDTDTTGSLSDRITWNGNVYKAMKCDDFSNYGFFHTIAVRAALS